MTSTIARRRKVTLASWMHTMTMLVLAVAVVACGADDSRSGGQTVDTTAGARGTVGGGGTVPGPQTRVFASVKATTIPKLGDALRVEIVGYMLKGYLNDVLVLQGTDTDATKIANGRPGLASRLSTGNGSLSVDSKVSESFAAGDL